VPFDFPEGAEAAAKPFERFHAARQAMQKKMDASIAATPIRKRSTTSRRNRRTSCASPARSRSRPCPSPPCCRWTKRNSRPKRMCPSPAPVNPPPAQWRDELLKTGIRGKGGQMLKFTELETLPGTTCLHCTGHLADTGERVVVSFGPEHGALEQRAGGTRAARSGRTCSRCRR
jgi:adenine-specific DNA-methyltransferase